MDVSSQSCLDIVGHVPLLHSFALSTFNEPRTIRRLSRMTTVRWIGKRDTWSKNIHHPSSIIQKQWPRSRRQNKKERIKKDAVQFKHKGCIWYPYMHVIWNTVNTSVLVVSWCFMIFLLHVQVFNTQHDDALQAKAIQQIMEATDHYMVIGASRDAAKQDLRRLYLKLSVSILKLRYAKCIKMWVDIYKMVFHSLCLEIG